MKREEYHDLLAKAGGMEDGDLYEIFKSIMRDHNPSYLTGDHKFNRYSPFIYFIQAGKDGPIKVGLSGDPLKRVRQLQTGHPEELHILLAFPGSREDEKAIHKLLDPLCVGGEWFANHPALQKAIAQYREFFYGDRELVNGLPTESMVAEPLFIHEVKDRWASALAYAKLTNDFSHDEIKRAARILISQGRGAFLFDYQTSDLTTYWRDDEIEEIAVIEPLKSAGNKEVGLEAGVLYRNGKEAGSHEVKTCKGELCREVRSWLTL